jgi:hypothetical protein
LTSGAELALCPHAQQATHCYSCDI